MKSSKGGCRLLGRVFWGLLGLWVEGALSDTVAGVAGAGGASEMREIVRDVILLKESVMALGKPGGSKVEDSKSEIIDNEAKYSLIRIDCALFVPDFDDGQVG